MLPNPVFLYVEDEPFSRKVLEMIMTRALGYQYVSIFENSEHFCQRIDALMPKPNIIFLDIHMKPINGFEMLKLLRQHPDYQDKQIVALTASVMNEEVDMLRHSGFNGAIAKPIDQMTFPALLERILNGEEVWNIAD
jgi:CheY-like chemotaxis protein